MTGKIHQKVNNFDSQNNIDSGNHHDEQIKAVVGIIGHYILHNGVHFFAINFVFVYILFKDAQENHLYMIDDVKTWTGANLIATFIILYCIVYTHCLYLAKKYTQHILPIMSCSIIYGLCYTILLLNQLIETNCRKRQTLSCKGTNTVVSNRILLLAKDYIGYTTILITMAICTYTIAMIYRNQKTKYYYYINPAKEFIALIIMYYLYGFLVFIIPILICICCASGAEANNSQVDMGNFINGTEIIDITEDIIQEP